ncbi:DUF1499 domain-containing protein [Vibrio rumoiensis]|uniref:DUF1499 domain-containing protein n=1 Tax=Vibrio rumoiensis 1S-45 TaxID=1188252 RepID=A0A1E5E3S7_9VIBR|nr:DUF1499 domain-containing protein [Vibrio rumoiensis]OEF26990.1 hypothetical protein A1QC_01080 [Vibrio rumoiensis 1S-45]
MKHRSSRFGSLVLIIAILAALSVAVMMFGAHLGLWDPIVGFGYIRNYMNPIAYMVVTLSAIGLAYQLSSSNGAGVVKSFVALLIGLGLLAPMLYGKMHPPKQYPPIHDITTDTVNPPQFITLDDHRPGAKNSLVYGGSKVAEQQHLAYSDIAPIYVSTPASEAFQQALNVGKSMGWEIVSQDFKKLRFEATARTPVFQFADDIVVVVTELKSTTRIDIRSVSRIGRGDRGVNANRIREFIQSF